MLTKKLITAALALSAFTFTPNYYHSPFIQVAHAEIKTYTGTGEYLMSDGETQDFAKEGAKMHAARAAQEQAGVFVGSNTKVKNHMVTSDEVETFTASIVKIIGEPKFEPVLIPGNDGKTYIKFIATVTVAVDTDYLNAQIDKWLNRDTQERSNFVEQNKSLQEIIDNQAKQIKRLESIIANANSAQDSVKIQSELKQIDKNSLYVQKFNAASDAAEKNNYYEALRLYLEASQLNPDYPETFYNLGYLYTELKQYDNAISAYNRAIELKPNYAAAYNNRGNAYGLLQQQNNAISDYNKAIELNPNFANAYYNRGTAYGTLKQYDLAISDFTRAIEINPNYASAYYNRGVAYKNSKKYKKAAADFNKYIEFNPQFMWAYKNLDDCYQALGGK